MNVRLTFSPVKYPYYALRRLHLSIQYPNVEEIYINLSVLFILKEPPIAFLSVSSLTNYLDILLNDRDCNIQSNSQPSTIKLVLMKNHQDQTNKRYRPHRGKPFIGRDDLLSVEGSPQAVSRLAHITCSCCMPRRSNAEHLLPFSAYAMLIRSLSMQYRVVRSYLTLKAFAG